MAKSPVPKAYPNLADQLNELIAKGFKVYADVEKKTGRVLKIYGELLNKKEFKAEKKRKKDLWQ